MDVHPTAHDAMATTITDVCDRAHAAMIVATHTSTSQSSWRVIELAPSSARPCNHAGRGAHRILKIAAVQKHHLAQRNRKWQVSVGMQHPASAIMAAHGSGRIRVRCASWAVVVVVVCGAACSLSQGSVLRRDEGITRSLNLSPPAADSQGWSYVVGVGADGVVWARSNRDGGAVTSGEASEVINQCVEGLPQPGGGTIFLTSGV